MSTKIVLSNCTEWRNEKWELHREDGPAIEYSDGCESWYQNGELHREGGPALEYPSGTVLWYQNGLLHRADGPAVENVNGDQEWYINGEIVTEEEHALLTWERLTQKQQDNIIFKKKES